MTKYFPHWFLLLLVSLLLAAAALPYSPENQVARNDVFEPPPGVFSCANGRVSFQSDAPLELIQATSKQLRGVLDPNKQTFGWSVEISSFDGFNNPLQREHFNENYLESKKNPQAKFTGKIIETIDFEQNGQHTIRAKGKLQIHGKEQERIIKCQLQINGNQIQVQSSFGILLADHDIRIPKIVYQKIAEEVTVQVEAVLIRKP